MVQWPIASSTAFRARFRDGCIDESRALFLQGGLRRKRSRRSPRAAIGSSRRRLPQKCVGAGLVKLAHVGKTLIPRECDRGNWLCGRVAPLQRTRCRRARGRTSEGHSRSVALAWTTHSARGGMEENLGNDHAYSMKIEVPQLDQPRLTRKLEKSGNTKNIICA